MAVLLMYYYVIFKSGLLCNQRGDVRALLHVETSSAIQMDQTHRGMVSNQP